MVSLLLSGRAHGGLLHGHRITIFFMMDLSGLSIFFEGIANSGALPIILQNHEFGGQRLQRNLSKAKKGLLVP